jgi:flavin reductase (DIM6/NTAB) family NADH-FMN oxidoreductase RutF
MRELDPETLSEPERYKLIIGCVTPRPIAFVSTMSVGGAPNLAPFSFFTSLGSTPMSLLFCPGVHADGRPKDTCVNARPEGEGGIGEFVVNLAVESIAREVAAASEPLPHGESEFALAKLTPAPSRKVRPPRVLESPVSFECATTHAIQADPTDAESSWVIIGKVVHVWIREDLVDERLRVNADELATFGRMGGPEYCLTRDRFSLPRGPAALDAALPFEPRGKK